MKKIIFLVVFLPNIALAAKWCDISDFTVDAYANGGTFLNGNINVYNGGFVKKVAFINLAGTTEGATNRRTSVALSAQMANKNLEVYFQDINECSEYTEYMVATTLRIKREI